MTKIAIVNDTHRGVRGGNPILAEHQSRFWKEIFFPYIDKHKIFEIFHLGDYFDNRKTMNIRCLREDREQFVEPCLDRTMKVHVIPGNHDCPRRDSLEYNSVREYFNYVPGFHVYEKPTSVDDVLLVPWITRGDKDTFLSDISNSRLPVCMGHFEIKGFDMYPGMPSRSGLGPDILSHFQSVYSGHFHTKSKQGNIEYLGSQFELTWSDWNDPKGFHIFDTDTNTISFVRNPLTLHAKIFYDDRKDKQPDPSEFKDKFVKIVKVFVSPSKQARSDFDLYTEKIKDAGAYEVRVVEPLRLNDAPTEVTSDGSIKKLNLQDSSDTLSLIEDFVSETSLYPDDQRAAIKALLGKTYKEAINDE